MPPGSRSAPERATSARIPQHVVHRAFARETVVLNLETGRYHGLNPTAGRMLVALESTGSIVEAVARLARELQQPHPRVESDLRRLCGELSERGLIELDALE